ncbi:uncharacterized protein V1516DRAFT_677805 [Lipomyces oligophaga]|uniref:uncharacterized protein n=1 Tax=Lipomyces oligophaga TaxID=45792 RepID=UPI0034CDE1C0
MAVSMNRIALAIRSNLPDEMDWALQTLVHSSFENPDALIFERFPNLAPALLEKLSSIDTVYDLEQLSKSDFDVSDDDLGFGVGSKSKGRQLLDKILEAALVLRNAAINPDNARYLAGIKLCQLALIKCLNLPERPSLIELRQYCLDIAESVTLFLHPRSSQDPLFRTLVAFLGTEDRGVLIPTMRAVARSVVAVETNLLQSVDPKLVARICSLVMLDDEDLLAVSLDFLYQYTSSSENIEISSDIVDWRDLIQQLIRLLLYQAQEWSTQVSVTEVAQVNRTPPAAAPPALPQDLLHGLLQLAEPERATQWMRACFEEDSEGDVTQIALWKAYESQFEEYVILGKRLLPAADFIKNVTMAYKHAAAMVVTLPNGQQKFIIKGIRPREAPLSLKGELYIDCQWTTSHGQCPNKFPSVKDLYKHILTVHVPLSLQSQSPVSNGNGILSPTTANTNAISNGSSDEVLIADAPTIAAIEKPIYFCKWKSCTRFDPDGVVNRHIVAAHIRTHVPDPEDNKPIPYAVRIGIIPETPKYPSTNRNDLKVQQHAFINKSTIVDERGDATGIPVTSVLVLRNIARSDLGKKYVKALVPEIISVATVNVPLRNYVADLLTFVEEKQGGAIL